jgi:hypothetical protein
LKEPLNNYKSKDRKKRRDWDREIKRTIEIEDNIFCCCRDNFGTHNLDNHPATYIRDGSRAEEQTPKICYRNETDMERVSFALAGLKSTEMKPSVQ